MATAKRMTEDQMRALARDAAQRNGLDPAWFEAQLAQESNYNPQAVSKAGARGVAQFMPRTAKALGVDPNDPVQSIEGAARYMAQLKRRFGDEETARLAYNWGEGNVAKYLAGTKRAMPKEAAEYNAKIAARMPQGAGTAVAAATPPAPQSVVRVPPAPAAQNDVDAVIAELDQGLPAGSLLQQPLQTPEPLPLMSQAPAAPVTPAAPTPALQTPQPSWLEALGGAPAGAPSTPVDTADFMSLLTDQAAQDQTALLASAFGDPNKPAPPSTKGLPAAVDRYLDRLLST